MRLRPTVLAGLIILASLVSGIVIGTVGATDSPTTVSEENSGARSLTATPDCSRASYAGHGTSTTPYRVGNITQLQCIGQQDSSAYYVLTSDINGNATTEWNGGDGFTPISSFNGSLNGSGYEITGLTINRSSANNVGLIGTVESGGIIKNITVSGADIHGGDLRTGGLVGQNYGTVRAATVEGDIDGVEELGGLVGSNSGQVLNSVAKGTVTGSTDVGGLIGQNDGTVETSHVRATVSGDWTVGGLVGNNQGTVQTSYAAGRVDGRKNSGGLIGVNLGTVHHVYATNAVTGSEAVGGLIGLNGLTVEEGTVELSYAAGPVTGNRKVGGLVGEQGLSGTVQESYWDRKATGQNTTNGGGTGLTTTQMTGPSAPKNMTAFDFPENWGSVAGDYPALSWQSVTKNLPPNVSLGSNKTLTEGSSVMLTASASDPDADSLTYDWSVVDGNGTLSGTGNSVVYNAPTVIHQETNVTAKVTVSDGAKSVSDTISIELTYSKRTQIDININDPQMSADSFSTVATNDLRLTLNKSQLQPSVVAISWKTTGPATVKSGEESEAVEISFTDEGTPSITAIVEIQSESGKRVTRQATVSGEVFEFDPGNHNINIEFGEGISLDNSRYRAAKILHLSGSIYPRIQQRMFDLPEQFTVRLVKPENRDDCLACAIGDDTVIIGSNVGQLQRTLEHEYTHIAQAHNNMNYEDEYWGAILEGFAVVEATQPHILTTTFESSKPTKEDLRTTNTSSLEEYEDAEILVEALMMKYGRQDTLELMENAADVPFTTRFKTVTGDSFNSFYEDWNPEDVNKGYTSTSTDQFPVFVYEENNLAAIGGLGVCTDNPCTSIKSLSPEWDIDNDGIFEKRGTTITWTPTEKGSYPITLRYTNENRSIAHTQQITVEETQSVIEGATDPDDDGVYEDVNGDGSINVLDVQAFFINLDGAAEDPSKFDFNDDGSVNVLDVQVLFSQIS